MQIMAQNQIIENVAKLMTAFTEMQTKNAENNIKKKTKRFKSRPVSVNVSLGGRDAGLYNVGTSVLHQSNDNNAHMFGSNQRIDQTRIEVTEPDGRPHLTKSAIIDLISSKLQVRLYEIMIFGMFELDHDISFTLFLNRLLIDLRANY